MRSRPGIAQSVCNAVALRDSLKIRPVMADQIRYDLLTQQALRGVVHRVLTDTARPYEKWRLLLPGASGPRLTELNPSGL